MRVKATFQHVFEVTREVEIDDEDFARLHKHQEIRDRDTSDAYLIPFLLNTQEAEHLAEVFPDWKTTAPLCDRIDRSGAGGSAVRRVASVGTGAHPEVRGNAVSPHDQARERVLPDAQTDRTVT